MLSKFYLLTIAQLFTEAVHASQDVKSILRNREICAKVPGYCTSKKIALMDDMADLVEITEDIFFPEQLKQLSVFSTPVLRRASMRQITSVLSKRVNMIEAVASNKDKAKSMRRQFAEYIRDNIVDHYDDYDISFDKYETKVLDTKQRSKDLVWNYVTSVIAALEYLKKDDVVVRKIMNLCPLRRKNRSFAAMTSSMTLEEPLSRSKRTQDTQLYPSFAVCTGDTQTIATQCSYQNWMSMGISWRLTDVAADIKKALCTAADNKLNK